MSTQPKKTGFFGRLFGREQEALPEEVTSAPEQADVQNSATLDVDTPAADPAPTDTDSDRTDTEYISDTVVVPETVDVAAPSTPAADEEPAQPAPAAAAKVGWFQRLKTGLTKTSSKLSEGITSVFAKRKLDSETLDDLEDLLIQADLGVETASRITDALSKGRYDKGIAPEEVRAVLASEIEKVLEPVAQPLVIDDAAKPHVILMVGVNGTGKTTTIGKLASKYIRAGKKVTIAAGDTFRAAAIDQLKVWGERSGATVIARDVGADSAGLAFDALTAARRDGHDVLLIDTAGRLQNKQGLMDELTKVVRVLQKIDPSTPHNTLLVLDATTGQNALDQVQVFQKQAGVTGLVMTKLDGTARGGILVAIAAKYGLPVHAIGIGEGIDDLQSFDARDFAKAIAVE